MTEKWNPLATQLEVNRTIERCISLTNTIA